MDSQNPSGTPRNVHQYAPMHPQLSIPPPYKYGLQGVPYPNQMLIPNPMPPANYQPLESLSYRNHLNGNGDAWNSSMAHGKNSNNGFVVNYGPWQFQCNGGGSLETMRNEGHNPYTPNFGSYQMQGVENVVATEEVESHLNENGESAAGSMTQEQAKFHNVDMEIEGLRRKIAFLEHKKLLKDLAAAVTAQLSGVPHPPCRSRNRKL